MKTRNIQKFIPFGIAVGLVLISTIQVLFAPKTLDEQGEVIRYTLNNTEIYAAFGLLVVLVFVILKQRIWKHLYAILLLLAVASFIQFYNVTFHLYIGFLEVEFTALGLLIFHLVVNKDVWYDFLNMFKKSEAEKLDEKHSKIRYFENQFRLKNQIELKQIVEQQELVPEAIEAAERLLRKK